MKFYYIYYKAAITLGLRCLLTVNGFVLQIGSHIRKQVTELGYSCTGLVSKAGALQCSQNDSYTKKELIDSARKVSEKVYSSSSSLI